MEKKEREEIRSKHWTEILADQLKEEKKQPYIITGGMTTSGPAHLGTVCEFLYPEVIRQTISGREEKTEFYFIGDILDAFDGIPYEMQKYTDILTPELGKPLVYVLDPMGCHKSFGIHYLEQAKVLMKKLSLKINVIEVNKLYDEGKFDPYTILFFKNEIKTREIIARTSMRKVEDLVDWSPIMPICEKCGKIATTKVITHTDDEYEYICNRDVEYTKGCAYKGKAKIKDHKYKLQWRLHWPSWQAIFNSSIEGSGLDHMTKGGSATTAPAVHRELFNTEPPILFKYGFVLINNKKYSKSKGIGMSATELLAFIPPELLKYALIEPDIQKDKDIDPNGDKLVLLYNDVERISTLKEPENRADEKKMLAFKVAVKTLSWKASFVDVLLNYQIFKDWKKVGEIVNDPDGVKYLAPYIEGWLAKGFAPDRYNFSVKQTKINTNQTAVKYFVSHLKSKMTDLEVHNLVYETAKSNNIGSEALFTALYTALIGKEKGPRIGKLIVSIGIDKTKEMLNYSVS